MTSKITINGKRVYSGTITDIENDRVYIQLENGQAGVLFANEISCIKLNLNSIFKIGDSVFIEIKQRLFDGKLLFSMKNILNKSVANFERGDEYYCVAVGKYHNGTIVQVTPSISAYLFNTYIPKGTLAVCSVYKTDLLSNRMSMQLSTVLYDSTIESLNMKIEYGEIKIVYQENLDSVA